MFCGAKFVLPVVLLLLVVSWFGDAFLPLAELRLHAPFTLSFRRRRSEQGFGAKSKRREDAEDDGGVGKQEGLEPQTSLPTEDDELLEYAIDSFLRGEYDREFADDAPAPHPGLEPGVVIDSALRALRQLDYPEKSHGAAVLMRFCLPLSRGDRWGDSSKTSRDPWKEVMRGSLTPGMLARRIRGSDFSGLLDWTSLDVTEGAYGQERDLVGAPSIAFVNAALFFGDGIEPSLIQFTLRRRGGVWLIDTARKSSRDLFLGSDGGDVSTD